MGVSTGSTPKPLAGWRVLVPRGGPWGHGVASDLRTVGAVPIVAPLINFAPTADSAALESALERLAAGDFDWLTVTSATTVDVLSAHQAEVPASTRIAAVGETTAAALSSAGYRVDLVPLEDNSAKGLLSEMKQFEEAGASLRILTLRSEIAKPVLSLGLAQRGHAVESVVAYRTIGVAVDPALREEVEAGLIRAILVTSGSVAEQVQLQLGPIPESTIVACIGPVTAQDARSYGLRVDLIAAKRSAESLIESLIGAAAALR
ncbi:uroporphyrinogen-III synthase [Subtercola boreus]|uniref:Uroporphyrinogen-III synthase n=1 Tax=Subtercola boreus TaxID=120213 RepID=A0A3E0WH61_9MICO|nr:uroporphyrinogen-III synthase [Subtercola boreus]RFA23481.1 uroporphyrinogen III synthase [Subtercola boreus]RFA23874.1 uroporphyrinogen III synthase [Subtercola boreus]RFA29575.1 uroporphyrinogen III synthase [Subtercola boreus]